MLTWQDPKAQNKTGFSTYSFAIEQGIFDKQDNLDPNKFLPLDILYLIKLSAYENEQMESFGFTSI